MQKFLKAIALTSVIFGSMTMTSIAEETTLLFATADAPSAQNNVRFVHPWAARVNAQSNGALRIDVRDGPAVANLSNAYDRVMNDVVQIAWGLHIGASGKFPRTAVHGLPFIVDRSEVGSVALWRLYASGILGPEYDDAVPLVMVGFPPAVLHFRTPLKAPDDLRGLKISTASKVVGSMLESLGAAPVSILPSDIYQSLQRGIVDGASTAWTTFPIYKLAEVTRYHVDAPLGGGTAMIFMARKKYQALPAAARTAIDANSGESATREFGRFWDEARGEGRKLVTDSNDQTIATLTPEQAERWREKFVPIEQEWARSTPDGVEVLARYRAFVAEATAGR